MSSSRSYTHPQPEEIVLARVLYALSDPIRLEMVRRLSTVEETDSLNLADDLSRSTLTYHTRILRENGVTYTRSQGRSCVIALRSADLEDRFPGLMSSVITSLGPSLVVTAISVFFWCLFGWLFLAPQQHTLITANPHDGTTAVAASASANYLGAALGSAAGAALIDFPLSANALAYPAAGMALVAWCIQLLRIRMNHPSPARV